MVKRFRNSSRGAKEIEILPNPQLPSAPESKIKDQDYVEALDEISERFEIDRNALHETYKDKKGVLTKRFNSLETLDQAGGMGFLGSIPAAGFFLYSLFQVAQTHDLTNGPYISAPLLAASAFFLFGSNKEIKTVKTKTRKEVDNHLKSLPPPKP